MTRMSVAIYGAAILFSLLVGLLFPDARFWSYWTVGSFAFHLLLSVVSQKFSQMPSQIAARSWQGISSLVVAGLLVGYSGSVGRGWLLAAVAVTGFTTLVTFAIGSFHYDAPTTSRPIEDERQPVVPA